MLVPKHNDDDVDRVEFRSLPSICSWLNGKLAESGWSQARLARHLGRDGTQVNHWRKGKEPIPAFTLSEIAGVLGSPADVRFVAGLDQCHAALRALNKLCGELAKSVGMSPAANPFCGRIVTLAETLTYETLHGNDADAVFHLLHFLTDAHFAVRLALQVINRSGTVPIVSEDNVARHLRFPVNRFMGVLLDAMPDQDGLLGKRDGARQLREACLTNIRRTAIPERNARPLQSLCLQHSVHLLARHGDEEDMNRVDDMIRSSDLFVRRMGLFGRLIRRRDDRTMSLLKNELQHNKLFAEATKAFDALHYGDSVLTRDGALAPVPSDVQRSIRKIARDMVHERNSQMLEIGILKLIGLLDSSGKDALEGGGLKCDIQPLVSQLVAKAPENRTSLENSLIAKLAEFPLQISLSGHHPTAGIRRTKRVERSLNGQANHGFPE